jgi:signal transduction histidine kinase
VSVAVASAAKPRGRVRQRVADIAGTAAYIAIGAPLAIAELIVLPLLLLGGPRQVWRAAALERRLANELLHARIPPLPDGSRGEPTHSVVQLFLLRAPAAVLAAAVAALPLALTLAFLILAAEGFQGEGGRYLGPWHLGSLFGGGLLLLAVAAAVVTLGVVDALAGPLRALARRFLLQTTSDGGAVREALAERIGDATLSIVYWVPDRGEYVDERGLPVALPEPDSGRAYTAVEHDGRRVAAIIHDAELDARPELIRAAAAGAVMALDNESLKAALRARVEELRASRARIVEASIDARRQLERDLHDGAQQQLVTLTLELRMLQGRVTGDPEVAALVDHALSTAEDAVSDLRELARGIHPAVLTRGGLPPAVEALSQRASIPIDVMIDMEERVTPAAEAAGYFVVAEALTNIAKYSGAERASVRVRREPDAITVEIADDGIGGADPGTGSGLRGLQDRVAALDGSLEVTSRPGEGTVVFARIPARPV